MRTYAITGGTDGIGRALGRLLLGRGDRVIALGSGAAKGAAFLAEAADLDAGARAHFVQADLSTLAGMRRAVERVAGLAGALDGAVFGAQRFQTTRVETADGLEFTFALAYLSRAVLGEGLLPLLERAERPVIANLAGPGGLPGTVAWDDLQLRRRYSGRRAAMQGSRCNDLLGADFPARHPGARTRYVLYNPGFVRTAMADPLPLPARAATKALALLLAQPAAAAAARVRELLDSPPPEPAAAFFRRRPVPMTGPDFDPAAAARLREVTDTLLADPRRRV
ncbi:SDR family NAD(P)-dependent oxidoreductase [Streptomonospora nanhaiensis]|uniref:NAD(P)-dependent dehydrogenase (Short-subunit alcohol dehydrogenase family) n=1 Tax=Streptomonospora nanhaiensis TaxID=1323731 RepID=A0A853BUP2_9ACTN|nr:SDR family NAD(P)-dependent oxidoreductase [Streptomonospora nanhaiensis]MBV2363659.1 SDR family NAD(P)-dependent oxidoreductase [Streptomonospora nanhaiensis]MBX9391566.1 SDR family NAD(P)-dependent oxidoreductase [Streptomonospora nanhaiensis]NYI98704.1 NAD(P)-dependent dehydrogenase (short-subunit alcohol dehydrogenase family) [Streptomonospora nanhaiensis]